MNIKIIDCPFAFFKAGPSTPKMQFFRAGTAQTIDLWQCILARANLRRFFTTLKMIMVNLPNGMAMTKI